MSRYICAMPFIFVAVDDEPGADSQRGLIERGAIGLLSNYRRATLDASSKSWLGAWSGRDRVRESGLWNNNHVEEEWGSSFLEQLERAAEDTVQHADPSVYRTDRGAAGSATVAQRNPQRRTSTNGLFVQLELGVDIGISTKDQWRASSERDVDTMLCQICISLMARNMTPTWVGSISN